MSSSAGSLSRELQSARAALPARAQLTIKGRAGDMRGCTQWGAHHAVACSAGGVQHFLAPGLDGFALVPPKHLRARPWLLPWPIDDVDRRLFGGCAVLAALDGVERQTCDAHLGFRTVGRCMYSFIPETALRCARDSTSRPILLLIFAPLVERDETVKWCKNRRSYHLCAVKLTYGRSTSWPRNFSTILTVLQLTPYVDFTAHTIADSCTI